MLNNKNILMGEANKVQGFMRIDVVNKKNNSKSTFKYNTVTDLGRFYMLAKSVGSMLMQPSYIERGNLYPVSSLGSVVQSTTAGAIQYDTNDDGLNLYLVNSADVNDKTSKLLPIYDANLDVDPNKVIGYAGFNRSTVNLKQGLLDYTLGEYLVDREVIVQRWKFDLTQAIGTFNKLCIGAGVMNNPFKGVALWKGLDGDLSLFDPLVNLTGAFMIPNVAGYTAQDEILVDDVTTGGQAYFARAVINLTTGVKTPLELTDPRYGIELGLADYPQLVVNGRWIRKPFSASTYYAKDLTTGNEINTNINGTYKILAYDGTKIWGYYNSTNIVEVDPSTYAFGNLKTYAELNLPAGFGAGASFNYLAMGSHNGEIFICDKQGLPYSFNGTLVATNLSNIGGSLTDRLPSVDSPCVATVNGKKVSFGSNIPSDNGLTKRADNANPYNPIYGVKMCEHALSGNMISFVDLASPITKTADDVVYVSYGYKFL